MTAYVVDASVFLAVIRDEKGAELAAKRLRGSSMSTVNASEVLMKGVEKGATLQMLRDFIASQNVELVPFDVDLAIATALLRQLTKPRGLSFADRACIATATRMNATVVTADRIWATLDLPCPIELIR